MGHGTAVWIMA